MVIEQAERFGLAALHQLRGRVGRSSKQSYCFLIYGSKLTDIAKERLKAMYETTDGFELAELDLKLRGPGEVAGIQQSGNLTLGLSDPIQDKEILEIARKEAIGMEECARKMRYSFLEEVSNQYGNIKIAVAHNRNDNVETIIGNIARGTTINGLKGRWTR